MAAWPAWSCGRHGCVARVAVWPWLIQRQSWRPAFCLVPALEHTAVCAESQDSFNLASFPRRASGVLPRTWVMTGPLWLHLGDSLGDFGARPRVCASPEGSRWMPARGPSSVSWALCRPACVALRGSSSQWRREGTGPSATAGQAQQAPCVTASWQSPLQTESGQHPGGVQGLRCPATGPSRGWEESYTVPRLRRPPLSQAANCSYPAQCTPAPLMTRLGLGTVPRQENLML